MCLTYYTFLGFRFSKNFVTVMGTGIGNSGIGKNGNGNRFLSWEWVGMGTEIVLPAHVYYGYTVAAAGDCYQSHM